MKEKQPSIFESLIVFGITLAIIALGLEFFLVNKNKDGKNYDIEMWKYSRQLKKISDNPKLGHEHIANKKALLQNTEIRINSLGMRGAEPDNIKPKFLILGSSITLGWGVEESKIYPEILQEKLADKYEVLNAGIGNYNSVREIEAFFAKYQDLKPKTILLSYFVNDAEIIPAPKRNWLLENSQLAVTLWSRLEQIKRKFGVQESFEEHYKNIYQDDYPGWLETQAAFNRLADYALKNDTRVIVTMIPDIHNLENYPFDFIHSKIKQVSAQNNFEYIDFLDSFKNINNQEELWAMPGDPHPNELGHAMMAEQILDYLTRSF